MELIELLKALFEHKLQKRELTEAEIEAQWQQFGKLTDEDRVRLRSMSAWADEKKREHDLYEAKMEAIVAEVKMKAMEWKAHLAKAYGLVSADYRVLDDGRIFREPEGK